MRNIFDQYAQPENRLTHALVCALNEDGKLLRKFVGLVDSYKPSKNVEVVGQKLPGDPEYDELEAERRGLPDACIFDDDWVLLIESKVSATLKNDQLRRHYNTVLRRGYKSISVLAIDVEKPKRKLPDYAKFISWSDIYIWLSKQSKSSSWALKTARYMEVAELKWSADGYLQKGALTVFAGIPFNEDNPYNYKEAKRVLRLAMGELRKNKPLIRSTGIDPDIEGRHAITGKQQEVVWDYLSVSDSRDADSFTSYPHFTIAIKNDHVFILVTVPNGIKTEFRKNLLLDDVEGFRSVLESICNNLSKVTKDVEGSIPWVEVLQRHYKSQRSAPSIDARLSYDLRTAFKAQANASESGIKYQPLWIEATFEALKNKRANTQLAVGMIFPYSTCPVVGSPGILKYITDAWIGCMPLVKKMLNG